MTRRVILGYLLLIFLAFCVVSLATYTPADSPDRLVAPRSSEVHNVGGKIGAYTASAFLNVVGIATPILLLAIFFVALALARNYHIANKLLRLVGFLLILISATTFAAATLTWSPGPAVGPGGFLGAMTFFLLQTHLSPTGILWIMTCIGLSGIILALDDALLFTTAFTLRYSQRALDIYRQRRERKNGNVAPQEKVIDAEKILDDAESVDEIPEPNVEPNSAQNIEENFAPTLKISYFASAPQPQVKPVIAESDSDSDSPAIDFAEIVEEEIAETYESSENVDLIAQDENEISDTATETPPILKPTLPSRDCLLASVPFDHSAYETAILEQAEFLQQAFADFGYRVQVVNIQTGPVISLYEIQLEKSLRLNKIMPLTEDLAVKLKVPTVRIVAPMPGRNTVGVEIPNTQRQMVRLRDVIEQAGDYRAMAIPIFLGQDGSGAPLCIDLAKLPHLLIAGRTGTGKSVCLNSIIVSILMSRLASEVKMLMIDPKMVELSPYKTIPHLLHPVVTDMKKAEAILGWAVEKMEERYKLLARAGVRQLSEYNKLSVAQLRGRVKPESESEWKEIPRSMPYLVIVADELADLMMTAGKEVEAHIIRLAQKSRAVGIHLVLATQKPTVDIITGLIKSNLPARIAFQVASRSDSQVVLDRNGAEKLLGNGDMLFLQPGTSAIARGQGTYVSDAEIEKVIEEVSLSPQEFAEELELLTVGGSGGAKNEPPAKETRDPLYARAVECVIGEGKGSVSLLQRKLEIGYGRAARMIDFMETDGIVGTSQGATPREVLMSISQWQQKQNSRD